MRFRELELLDSHESPVLKTFHSAKVQTGRRAFWEHHHTACELSTVCSGSGQYTVNGKTYDFYAGDVFLFGSHEVHCITDISPDEPFDLLNVQFEPRLLWGSSNGAGLKLLQIFFNRSNLFENRIDRSNPKTQEIRQGIFLLEKELEAKRFGYEVKTKIMLYDFLLTLSRDYGYIKDEETESVTKSVLKQLERATHFIEENLANPITLDEIAKHVAMNKTYFSTTFKRLNGISPWDYITIKRVEKAVELMKTTDLSKTNIAAQCGFNSSSNFYKAFHKIIGRSPKEFLSN